MEDTIGRPAETECMIALGLTIDFILEGCGKFIPGCPAGSDRDNSQ